VPVRAACFDVSMRRRCSELVPLRRSRRDGRTASEEEPPRWPDRHGKEGVAGSSPAEGFKNRAAARFSCSRSGSGDHFLDAQRVAGPGERGHIVRRGRDRGSRCGGSRGDHPPWWAGRVLSGYRSIWWAARSERNRPADALAVYQRIADEALERADRRAYRSAPRILKRAQAAAEAAGAHDAFAEYLTRRREQYRRRPSLIEILDKADLG